MGRKTFVWAFFIIAVWHVGVGFFVYNSHPFQDWRYIRAVNHLVQGDAVYAFDQIHQLADMRHVGSACLLSYVYTVGYQDEGGVFQVKADFDQLLRYGPYAAKAKCSPAAYMLGVMYQRRYEESGIAEDREQAVSWLKDSLDLVDYLSTVDTNFIEYPHAIKRLRAIDPDFDDVGGYQLNEEEVPDIAILQSSSVQSFFIRELAYIIHRNMTMIPDER